MKKILVIAAFALLMPQPAFGCTIPVFRYALENWDLTSYEITVSHRGTLPAALRKALDRWSATPSRANVEITIVNLDDPIDAKVSKKLLAAWKAEGNDEQKPWMSVRYQAADSTVVRPLSGPCTVATLGNLVDSPTRQAILAHLSRGVCGVFVLVPSGDAKADEAAYDLAVKELTWLEKKIKLPEQSKDGPQLKLPLPLAVSFPIIVLDRASGQEAAFKHLLLATEDGLADVKGPILFALFGRGRVLGSLSGDELNADKIQQVGKFLCRECSCQLKELNPGIDMLMAAEWPQIFDRLYDGKPPLAMPAGVLHLLPGEPQTPEARTVPSEPTVATVEAAPDCSLCRTWLWIAIGVAGVLVLGTGTWVCCSLRKY